jgi:hypothetical protein
MRIVFVELADGTDLARMAANGTAIGDDHVTRLRRPNWTIRAPSGALPTFAARRP